jgi:hypothetical protein
MSPANPPATADPTPALSPEDSALLSRAVCRVLDGLIAQADAGGDPTPASDGDRHEPAA